LCDTLPEPDELTAASVFDDFTTVAPCSLTDPSVFDTFGSTTFGEPESTFDYCTVLVRTAAGAMVSVDIGLFEELAAIPELESQRVRDVEGGMWVGQPPRRYFVVHTGAGVPGRRDRGGVRL